MLIKTVGLVAAKELAEFILIENTLKLFRRKKNMKNLTFAQLKQQVSYTGVRDAKLAVQHKIDKAMGAVKSTAAVVNKVLPATNGALDKEMEHTDRTIAVMEARLQQLEDTLVLAGMLEEEAVLNPDMEHVEVIFKTLRDTRKVARKASKGKLIAAVQEAAEKAEKAVQRVVEPEADDVEVEVIQPEVKAPKSNKGGGRRLNFDAAQE